MNPFVIDAFDFCRVKESREGERSVAEFARLSEEVANTTGSVHWSVQGGTHALGYPMLHVSVQANVQLMCQRCLTPYTFEIESESVLVLAKNEDAADEMEEKMADEDVDVIVGSKTMNFIDLIEDEVLLEIPLSPRHEVCPDQVGQNVEAAASVKKTSPFEVLKNKQ
jgi:uncharacterized protein